jgi:hypothetical protein
LKEAHFGGKLLQLGGKLFLFVAKQRQVGEKGVH